MRRRLGVAHRLLDVLVPEIGLQRRIQRQTSFTVPSCSGFTQSPISGIKGDAGAATEDHIRRDALLRRARGDDPLLGLSVQPLHRDRGGPMG